MEQQLPTQPIPPVAQPVNQAAPTTQKKKNYWWVLLIIIVLVVGALGWFGYQQFFTGRILAIPDQKTLHQLPTYFSYTSEDLQSLKNVQQPESLTTTEDLRHWEEVAYELVAKNKTVDPSKLYTYLLVARRDSLILTQSMFKEFRGDTAVLSKKIICEFYPSDCSSIEVPTTDPFSEKLAEIILQKVKQRIQEDAAVTNDYPLKNDQKYWYANPQLGRDAGSYKPWLIERGDQFRVPENPEFAVQNFQEQLSQVKTALANITSEQRKAVVFWAGGPGTKTPSGIWLDIAGEYMLKKTVSVATYLDTQALLSMAMTDSLIGCFDSKYTYQVKRPYMVDPTIKTVMPTPNHPSYPAGHSCVSNSASTVLSSVLSDNSIEWQRLAKEASSSRIWGGIHYPADDEQGTNLGQQVGEYATNRFNQL